MFYSQGSHPRYDLLQDKFVCENLQFKKNGTFLDVGCHDYKYINNTYYLESQLNWSGIGIDIDCSFKEEWEKNRKAPFLCVDALSIDYNQLLKDHKMPQIIDYLSLDLEPPSLTLEVLFKIFESNFSFNVITFETDNYRNKTTRTPSRELLINKGFVLVHETEQDDFYTHKRIMT